jgi:recombinational DNA repair protein (RecF pathway)
MEAIQELTELELLGHGFDHLEHCARCRRTLLVGEHVHVYDGERIVCDLCRTFERDSPLVERLVHGPAFGNTIRIIDQRGRDKERARKRANG